MSPVQKTGLYYPNKFGLIIIKSLEEVMGRNGLNAILNLAGLNNYIENYPPDNLDKGFDFAELSAVGVALEEMYGPRGGRGLALRAGRATFSDALKNFGALAGAIHVPSSIDVISRRMALTSCSARAIRGGSSRSADRCLRCFLK